MKVRNNLYYIFSIWEVEEVYYWLEVSMSYIVNLRQYELQLDLDRGWEGGDNNKIIIKLIIILKIVIFKSIL